MLLFSTVLDIKESMTADDFIRLVVEWNQTNPHQENVIPGLVWNGERNIRYGSDALWLEIEEYRNKNIIAVRYEKKDANGAIWDSDYVMNFELGKMSIRLDRSYTDDALDKDKKFSTPHFITLLIDKGYIKPDHGLEMNYKGIVIGEGNLDLLTDVISGKASYDLPVVYVSKTPGNNDPVDVAVLAKRLKGVAHVFREETVELDHLIREKTEEKNEYLGAIGIYYLKTGKHRRFLYRSAYGYDAFLMEKVISNIVSNSTTHRIDKLFTWEGVKGALLSDRLNAQKEERAKAEQARERAEIETSEVIDTFDSDIKKLQEQVDDLLNRNVALQMENQGLKAKLDSKESVPVLYMGDEYEFYQGEIKDILLAVLTEALKGIGDGTRRSDVVKDIIDSNEYEKIGLTKAQEVKRILKTYDGMSAKTRQALMELGFEITEEGKHYKVRYYGDGRYQMTFSKTPSDGRTGKNCAQETANIAF